MDDIIVNAEGLSSNSIAEGELQTYTITPSMITINKTFKPREIHAKRSGAIQSRINITNIGRFNISKLEIIDNLLLEWKLKNKNSLSFSIYIDEKEYGMQFKAAAISLDEEKVEVGIDFSKGIEITDEDGNKQVIYALESDWSLVMKYPMHPPKDVESGLHTTTVNVKVTTPPMLDLEEGVSMNWSTEAYFEIEG